MATGDLTTLQDVKGYIGLSATSDDALLGRLISEHSKAIKSFLNRDITSQSYNDNLDGLGGQEMLFPQYPVTAVASLAISNRAIPQAAGAFDAGFRFDAKRLVLNGYRFDRGFMNVAISYTAGYSTVPEDIVGACIKWVADSYKQKDRLGQSSKTLQGAETVSFIVKAMPDSVKSALNQYKKVAPF